MLFTIIIVAGTDVYLASSAFDEVVHGLFVLGADVPIFGKVVPDAIGDDSDGNVFLVFCVGVHNAVDGIVQCAVSPYDDNGAVAVVCQYASQPFHGPESFGLYIVVRHTFTVHVLFDFFPSFLDFPCSGFGVIYDSPFIGFYAHESLFYCSINWVTNAIFSSILHWAFIQWMVKPRRSMPLNHVICRLAN